MPRSLRFASHHVWCSATVIGGWNLRLKLPSFFHMLPFVLMSNDATAWQTATCADHHSIYRFIYKTNGSRKTDIRLKYDKTGQVRINEAHIVAHLGEDSVASFSKSTRSFLLIQLSLLAVSQLCTATERTSGKLLRTVGSSAIGGRSSRGSMFVVRPDGNGARHSLLETTMRSGALHLKRGAMHHPGVRQVSVVARLSRKA